MKVLMFSLCLIVQVFLLFHLLTGGIPAENVGIAFIANVLLFGAEIAIVRS